MKVVANRKIVFDDDTDRALKLEDCFLSRWEHSGTDLSAAVVAAASHKMNWDSDYREVVLQAASSDGVKMGIQDA